MIEEKIVEAEKFFPGKHQGQQAGAEYPPLQFAGNQEQKEQEKTNRYTQVGGPAVYDRAPQ